MNNDLISREALKKAIRKRLCISSLEYLTEQEKVIVEEIDNAPTVVLTETEIQEVLNKRCMTAVANEYLVALHGKRPQGEWIYKNPKDYECSCCGYSDTNDVAPYCWHCGADMRGKNEK